MAYARMREQLLIHGSVASRLIKNLAEGLRCCVTTTHFDGLVYARSSFNSSINYRSVMVFGVAQLVIETFSVKQRVGGPSDAKSDMKTPIWAGVVPLETVAGEPIDSPDLMAGIKRPDYL